MAIIPVPSAMKIREASWRLTSPSQANHSAYTGRRKVLADPWHSRWTAQIQLAPLTAADMRLLRSFAAQLRGVVNTFRLEAVEEAQTVLAPGAITASGATAALSRTMLTAGWTASTAAVAKAGMLFTVNDQLCVLTADANSGADGLATLAFEPPLRAAVAGGAAVEVRLPTALVALTTPDFGWTAQLGPIYDLSFEVEEVF